MSVHISSAVWRSSEARGNSLLVLLALADQAHDDGAAWPSVKNLADRCRLSERAVQDQLVILEGLGELVRDFRPNRSTVYRVLLGADEPRGAESAPGAAGRTTEVRDGAPGGAAGRTQKRKEPLVEPSLEEFDRFWAVYPRREAKGAAMKAWARAVRAGRSPEVLIAGALAYRTSSVAAGTERRFVALPATWINANHDDDEAAPPVSGSSPVSDRWRVPAPPAAIADDPVACRRWVDEQVAAHRAEVSA